MTAGDLLDLTDPPFYDPDFLDPLEPFDFYEPASSTIGGGGGVGVLSNFARPNLDLNAPPNIAEKAFGVGVGVGALSLSDVFSGESSF